MIRGPGSVTLGQGALLGVINIITKHDALTASDGTFAEVSGSFGENNLSGGNVQVGNHNGEIKTYFSAGFHNYGGQKLKREGWTQDQRNEGYLGGSIADIGTRLKKTRNMNLMGNLQYKNLGVNLMYLDQSRDLYNFFRDRNVIRQSLVSASLNYNIKFSDNVALRTNLNLASDDFGLSSVDGFVMGGTKENRGGAKVILNIASFEKHSIAVGGEFRNFWLGRKNRDGYNFINNSVSSDVLDPSYIENANAKKIWVFRDDLSVYSFFAEDFIEFSEQWSLFAAFRFDRHPYWGSNFSPRIGAIFMLNESVDFKLSFQEGFRGAVGVQYSGGFLEDGFLRTDNFSEVEEANIPVFDDNGNQIGTEGNINETNPEKIKSLEFTVNWEISEKLNFNAVSFYNVIDNVIDVGVISHDTSQYQLTTIGKDLAGDWNGFWFFKNTNGNIGEVGLEASLLYKSEILFLNFSHSLVKVVESDEQQRGSMYLTNEDNFKAYPQNVSRVNVLLSISKNLTSAINYLYYYNWFSPKNQKVDGNHLVNLSLKYKIHQNISLHGSLINALGSNKLYPMTSNVDNPTLSDGSPSVERTSFWFGLKVNL